jgi:hypothetical protein
MKPVHYSAAKGARGAVFDRSMAEWEARLNLYLGHLGKE